MWRSILFLFVGVVISRLEAAPVFDAEAQRGMLAGFALEEARISERLVKMPDGVELLSGRGDLRLFRGKFPEAVADYERMISLDPAQDAPHWRLGIAYHLMGNFKKAADQFAKYHAHDARDRENGIWEFLGRARVDGVEAARGRMLVYTRFDREPFPALYALLAGTKTEEELFGELEKKGLSEERTVRFFAEYYAGLNCELLGDKRKALEHLERAVQVGWTGDERQSYMWQVARVQSEMLAATP